jgi:hypothetical protein
VRIYEKRGASSCAQERIEGDEKAFGEDDQEKVRKE